MAGFESVRHCQIRKDLSTTLCSGPVVFRAAYRFGRLHNPYAGILSDFLGDFKDFTVF